MYGLDDADNASLSIHTLADGDSVRLMTATPAFERPDLLPLSIVKSTLATQKPIIRNDSQDYIFDTSFAKDRYYLSRHEGLRSVLCMPIPSGDSEKPRGVLYLENNATSSAFTNQRLECLTLLCTQSAMTLSRAAIYHEMRAAKAQAEEATAQKSTFLANMSVSLLTSEFHPLTDRIARNKDAIQCTAILCHLPLGHQSNTDSKRLCVDHQGFCDSDLVHH